MLNNHTARTLNVNGLTVTGADLAEYLVSRSIDSGQSRHHKTAWTHGFLPSSLANSSPR